MAYTTTQRIIDAITLQSLIHLTDDTNQDAVGAAVVDAAITSADTLIDTYLGGRYAIPVAAPVPDVIVKISTDLTIYNLYLRRFDANEDALKVARKRYEDALDLLKRISAGQIVLGIALPVEPAGGAPVVMTNCRPKIYTKQRLDQM